jgi:tetratricopeptide (TPR) repeat protein
MAASELFRQLEDAWQITYTLLLTANFYDDTNHPSELRRLAEEALEIQKMIGDPTLEAKMLDHLASSYLFEGKAEEGIGTMHQAVKSYQQTGLPAKAAEALMRYSVALAWGGLFKESLELSLQSFSLYKSLGKEMPEYGKMIICLLKMFLGHYDEQFRLVEEFDLPHLSRHYYLIFAGAAFLVIGEIDQAERLLEEAIGLHFKIGDYRLLTYFRALLSVTHYRGGDLPGAWNILQEAVRGWNEETNVLATCHLLLVSAFFLAELGELEKALEIYTAALQYRHMSNSVWAQDFAGKEITRRTSSLPAEVLAAAQARGERLNSKQAIEEGMEALREKPEWGEGLPRKGTRRHE